MKNQKLFFHKRVVILIHAYITNGCEKEDAL